MSEEKEYTLWMSELLNDSTLTVLEGVHLSHSSSHTAFWIMEIIVLLSLSVRPLDVLWYGIVRVFAISFFFSLRQVFAISTISKIV